MKRVVLLTIILGSLMFSFDASAQINPGRQYLDPADSSCWGVSIDPANPCYSRAGYPDCNKNYTNQTECLAYCACGYKYNYEKCKGGLTCQRLAKTEKDACDYQCIIDFA